MAQEEQNYFETLLYPPPQTPDVGVGQDESPPEIEGWVVRADCVMRSKSIPIPCFHYKHYIKLDVPALVVGQNAILQAYQLPPAILSPGDLAHVQGRTFQYTNAETNIWEPIPADLYTQPVLSPVVGSDGLHALLGRKMTEAYPTWMTHWSWGMCKSHFARRNETGHESSLSGSSVEEDERDEGVNKTVTIRVPPRNNVQAPTTPTSATRHRLPPTPTSEPRPARPVSPLFASTRSSAATEGAAAIPATADRPTVGCASLKRQRSLSVSSSEPTECDMEYDLSGMSPDGMLCAMQEIQKKNAQVKAQIEQELDSLKARFEKEKQALSTNRKILKRLKREYGKDTE